MYSSFRIFLTFVALLQYPVEQLEDIENTDLMRMESHNQTRSFEDELKYITITIMMLVLLRKTSYYNGLIQENTSCSNNLNNKELKIAEIIDHLLRVQHYNAHPILTTLDNINEQQFPKKEKELNIGLCRLGSCINVVLGSNFNHSCNPNTLRINTFSPLRTMLVASRNIPKGIQMRNKLNVINQININ